MNANFHTHTTYCDGELTVEQMVRAAIDKGMDALGFSEHSYLSFDDFCMSRDGTHEYMRDVRQLAQKYPEIELYLGIEQEYYAEWIVPPEEFDFIIGAVHYVKTGGKFVSLDDGAQAQRQVVLDHFGGDYYAMAEAYFDTVAALADTPCDFIAHFDLCAKYNNLDPLAPLFDELHPRYVNAALRAMDTLVSAGKPFEVNTGAMYRLGRPEPYPSAFFLRELHRRGAQVLLSSDSHDAQSLCHGFEDMKTLLRSCGFTHIKRLTRNGFVDVAI